MKWIINKTREINEEKCLIKSKNKNNQPIDADDVFTYSSSGVNIAGSRVNWGSKFDVKSASLGSNVGIKGGGISFCASFLF